jgi:hypothetical protein
MSMRTRCWLLACPALALAVLGVVGFLVWGGDTQEAVCRRVRLDVDADAACDAVGRPPDDVYREWDRAGQTVRRVPLW